MPSRSPPSILRTPYPPPRPSLLLPSTLWFTHRQRAPFLPQLRSCCPTPRLLWTPWPSLFPTSALTSSSYKNKTFSSLPWWLFSPNKWLRSRLLSLLFRPLHLDRYRLELCPHASFVLVLPAPPYSPAPPSSRRCHWAGSFSLSFPALSPAPPLTRRCLYSPAPTITRGCLYSPAPNITRGCLWPVLPFVLLVSSAPITTRRSSWHLTTPFLSFF